MKIAPTHSPFSSPGIGENDLNQLVFAAESNSSSKTFEQWLQKAGNEQESAPASMEKASHQMEVLFATTMLKIMEETGTENGLLGKASQGMGYFKDLFLESVAEDIVEGKGLGFRDSLANIYRANK